MEQKKDNKTNPITPAKNAGAVPPKQEKKSILELLEEDDEFEVILHFASFCLCIH